MKQCSNANATFMKVKEESLGRRLLDWRSDCGFLPSSLLPLPCGIGIGIGIGRCILYMFITLAEGVLSRTNSFHFRLRSLHIFPRKSYVEFLASRIVCTETYTRPLYLFHII